MDGGAEIEVLQSIRAMLPDITKLGNEKVQIQRENEDLRARIDELERLLAEARSEVSRKTSELKHANLRIRELESLLKRKPVAPTPVRPPPPSEPEEVDLSDDLFDDSDEPPSPTERQVRPRYKKMSLLPPRSTIPDLIARIGDTSPDNMGPLITSVLCEQHPSVIAMKKFYTNLLNSTYVKLLTLKRDSPDVKSYLAFIARFSERVSPKVFSTFTAKIAANADIASFVRAYREVCELDDM